jgi:CHAT domain-containing protein
MPPDHVGLEYFFSSRELFVFVTGKGESRAIALPVTQAEIGGQVLRYRQSAVNGDERAFSDLSRQLYDELVGPVLDRISPEADSTLVIFPDGPLHELPFAGLRDAQDRFLLEKHAIAYAPSAGILSRCLSLNQGDAGSLERSVVLLDGSDNLRNARDELAGLDRLYGRNARFLSAAELSAAGSGTLISEILHFAGHSVVRDGNPCLVVHAGSGETALDPETISSWRLRANRLVNLSGCETGTGPQAGGGTPWGLVPAFLNAGAPALVVSLLPVTDSSTRKMNARFYELLSGGSVSKASALRQAQLSILSSERSTGRVNPASWIPYVLVGDPR